MEQVSQNQVLSELGILPNLTASEISAFRNELGMSKTQFANRINACPDTVVKWEQGVTPNIRYANDIIDLYVEEIGKQQDNTLDEQDTVEYYQKKVRKFKERYE